jgi:glyoxylase-like metal-dependent hydrolase (beta-lactamase superfamily II)
MITTNRRRFLQTTGIAVLGGLAGSAPQLGAAQAAAPSAAGQAAGFYRFRLGEFEVVVLSDGYFELPSDSIATNAPAEERKAYFETRFIPLDKFPLQASPLLIDTGEKRVLIDAGVGVENGWAPGAGRLGNALAAAGIDPGIIDMVVLTHAHPDHLDGAIETATKAPLFPNAELVLSDAELDVWTSADAATKIPDWAQDRPAAVRSAVAAFGEKVRTIKPGEDVAAGIRTLHTPGHTQGHLSLMIDSDGDQLFVTGDAVAGVHIAMERPDWQIIWDHDRELGAKTRKRLLDQMATDRLLVSGYHFPFPGIGRVVRNGNGYHWLPADWLWPA